jgi:hypothetical protein
VYFIATFFVSTNSGEIQLERILPDIDELLCIGIKEGDRWMDVDSDPALPEVLWEEQHYK